MPARRPWPALILALLMWPGIVAAQDATVGLRAAPDADWRGLADADDRGRLAALPDAWAEALESVRGDGRLADVVAAGALLDSRPGRDGAQPEPGAYRCRVLRLGAVDGGPAFTAFAPFRCRVSLKHGMTVFEKLTGSTRIAGVILAETPLRSVLVGTEASGTEGAFPRYGAEPLRNRIAAVERVDANRWRLVFPRPPQGATVEVMELTRSTAAPAPPSSPAPARSGTSRRG